MVNNEKMDNKFYVGQLNTLSNLLDLPFLSPLYGCWFISSNYTICLRNFAVCRCHDFCKNIFNDRTVIVCDQCEREYHIGCLREHSMADLQVYINP